MDIENIKARILEDARVEAEEIITDADRECKEIEQKAEGEVREIEGVLRGRASAAGMAERERLVSQARINANKRKVAAKRAVLDECFEMALANVTNSRGEGEIQSYGRVLIDCRAGEVLRAIRPELEVEVAKMLWE